MSHCGVSDGIQQLQTKLNAMEAELLQTWKTLEFLSCDYLRMSQRLETVELLLDRQQATIHRLVGLYHSSSTTASALDTSDMASSTLRRELSDEDFVAQLMAQLRNVDSQLVQSEAPASMAVPASTTADEAFYRSLNSAHRESPSFVSESDNELKMIWEANEMAASGDCPSLNLRPSPLQSSNAVSAVTDDQRNDDESRNDDEGRNDVFSSLEYFNYRGSASATVQPPEDEPPTWLMGWPSPNRPAMTPAETEAAMLHEQLRLAFLESKLKRSQRDVSPTVFPDNTDRRRHTPATTTYGLRNAVTSAKRIDALSANGSSSFCSYHQEAAVASEPASSVQISTATTASKSPVKTFPMPPPKKLISSSDQRPLTPLPSGSNPNDQTSDSIVASVPEPVSSLHLVSTTATTWIRSPLRTATLSSAPTIHRSPTKTTNTTCSCTTRSDSGVSSLSGNWSSFEKSPGSPKHSSHSLLSTSFGVASSDVATLGMNNHRRQSSASKGSVLTTETWNLLGSICSVAPTPVVTASDGGNRNPPALQNHRVPGPPPIPPKYRQSTEPPSFPPPVLPPPPLPQNLDQDWYSHGVVYPSDNYRSNTPSPAPGSAPEAAEALSMVPPPAPSDYHQNQNQNQLNQQRHYHHHPEQEKLRTAKNMLREGEGAKIPAELHYDAARLVQRSPFAFPIQPVMDTDSSPQHRPLYQNLQPQSVSHSQSNQNINENLSKNYESNSIINDYEDDDIDAAFYRDGCANRPMSEASSDQGNGSAYLLSSSQVIVSQCGYISIASSSKVAGRSPGCASASGTTSFGKSGGNASRGKSLRWLPTFGRLGTKGRSCSLPGFSGVDDSFAPVLDVATGRHGQPSLTSNRVAEGTATKRSGLGWARSSNFGRASSLPRLKKGTAKNVMSKLSSLVSRGGSNNNSTNNNKPVDPQLYGHCTDFDYQTSLREERLFHMPVAGGGNSNGNPKNRKKNNTTQPQQGERRHLISYFNEGFDLGNDWDHIKTDPSEPVAAVHDDAMAPFSTGWSPVARLSTSSIVGSNEFAVSRAVGRYRRQLNTALGSTIEQPPTPTTSQPQPASPVLPLPQSPMSELVLPDVTCVLSQITPDSEGMLSSETQTAEVAFARVPSSSLLPLASYLEVGAVTSALSTSLPDVHERPTSMNECPMNMTASAGASRNTSRMPSRWQSTEESIDTEDEWYLYGMKQLELEMERTAKQSDTTVPSPSDQLGQSCPQTSENTATSMPTVLQGVSATIDAAPSNSNHLLAGDIFAEMAEPVPACVEATADELKLVSSSTQEHTLEHRTSQELETPGSHLSVTQQIHWNKLYVDEDDQDDNDDDQQEDYSSGETSGPDSPMDEPNDADDSVACEAPSYDCDLSETQGESLPPLPPQLSQPVAPLSTKTGSEFGFSGPVSLLSGAGSKASNIASSVFSFFASSSTSVPGLTSVTPTPEASSTIAPSQEDSVALHSPSGPIAAYPTLTEDTAAIATLVVSESTPDATPGGADPQSTVVDPDAPESALGSPRAGKAGAARWKLVKTLRDKKAEPKAAAVSPTAVQAVRFLTSACSSSLQRQHCWLNLTLRNTTLRITGCFFALHDELSCNSIEKLIKLCALFYNNGTKPVLHSIIDWSYSCRRRCDV